MPAKTERITILGTPEFKAFLINQAKQQGVSLSEFVRKRCLDESSDKDQQLFLHLVKEVNTATRKAKRSLEKGIADAESVISELRAKHECN